MEQSKIDRINELARLVKERALTGDEEAERVCLRREYVESVKCRLTDHLDNTYVVDEAGVKRKLQRKE